MKKNTVATAIIAGLAGVAGIANISTAVNLNPDGVGQVLLYPYYSVNANNVTALSVVNTTEHGKAVKVRFLDAMNSRDTLDFNLYLSGFDVWTAVLFAQSATGPANILTTDTSCTVPGIEDGIFQIPVLADGRRYFPFRTTFFTDQATLSPGNTRARGPSSGNARTRTGYAEILEMGTIRNETGFGFALTHINGRPADCASIEGAWLAAGTPGGSGIWLTPGAIGAQDVTAPSGGLFGGAAIVNVGEGTYINYNAEAIDGFMANRFHTAPGAATPNLTSGNQAGGGVVTSYVFDRGRLITSSWTAANNGSVDAVSAVLMREAVFNEYEVDEALGAASEWVVTFPTRRHYVQGPASSDTRAPFTVGWSSCERFSGRIYDREEATFRIFEGSPATGFTTFCREANVLWFHPRRGIADAASPIMGEPAFLQIPTYLELFEQVQYSFENGWFWFGFYDLNAIDNSGQANPLARPQLVETAPNAQSNDPTADRFFGLPAIGFWALKVTNRNQGQGLQATYGGAYPHRSSRACFKGAYGDSPTCG